MAFKFFLRKGAHMLMLIHKNLSVHSDGVKLVLHVSPKASREFLFMRTDETLGLKVRAPALENKANQRIIELLAKWLAMPKSALSIVRGARSKHKELLIRGIAREALAEKILLLIENKINENCT